MAIGAEVAQPQPAVLGTARMRTKVQRGVADTRAAGERRHGGGSSWRLRLGMVGLVDAQRAMRSLGETHKRFGLVGPLARQLRGHGLHRWRRGHRVLAWPEVMQHDAAPQESHKHQLVGDMVQNPCNAPS